MKREDWFGSEHCISEWATPDVISYLREVGEDILADEIAVPERSRATDQFGVADRLSPILSKFFRTTNVCGFMGIQDGTMQPVSLVNPEPGLTGKRVRLSLEGLHVAKYPGLGTHRLLFDFAVQLQGGKSSRVYHYSAKFQARDGETVPVHGFPLFQELPVGADGLVLGFQIVNLSSGADETLLNFLNTDEFKQGLNLASLTTPLLGQVSRVAASLAAWGSQRSRGAKVLEFHQGLGLAVSTLGGGLSPGYYVVAQIPAEREPAWNWGEWTISPTSARLVNSRAPLRGLDFNHVVIGIVET